MVSIGNEWDNLLKDEWDKEYYQKLRGFLAGEYRSKVIYPNMHDIFNALKYTGYDNVKAVILGQDPYHGEGQAHGLCFSVREGVPAPPSLINIFKEIKDDIGSVSITNSGDITSWAKQGVLLLNTVLTVRGGQANSHRGQGWEAFTDLIIKMLNEREKPIVFILWGRPAKEKMQLIDTYKHLVLTAAHPSPLSAHSGFFGCKHFSKANEFLVRNGQEPIVW